MRRLKELEVDNGRLKRTLRTKNSRTWRCGRSPGETGEPVEASSGRAHVARAARHFAAAGMPNRRAAPLHPLRLWALRDSNPRPPPCKASEAERCAQPRFRRSALSETRTVRGCRRPAVHRGARSGASGASSLPRGGRHRVERSAGGASGRFEGVLPSRLQRGLVHGGSKRRDALLDVGVARPDLKWLVACAAYSS